MNEIKNVWQEGFLSLTLIILLLLFINPWEIFGMTHEAEMALLGIFVLLFGVFVAFVWRERPIDEREELHLRLAGRAAFLAGISILALGIAVEMVAGQKNIWLLLSLGGMLLSKFVTLAYLRWKC